MNYFTITDPADWKPSAIYASYKKTYPQHTREQLLFAIHKDLTFFRENDSPTGTAAKNWLKKWSSIKGNFKETPSDGNNSNQEASAQSSSNADTSIAQTIGINNGKVTQTIKVSNFYDKPASSGNRSINDTNKRPSSSAACSPSRNAKKPKIAVHADNEEGQEKDECAEPESVVQERDEVNSEVEQTVGTLEFAQWIREFAQMTWIEQLEHLYAKHGDKNHLDLMAMRLSKRQATMVKHCLKSLKFSFAVTKEEAVCLARLRKCTNQNEFDALKVDLFKRSQVSPGIEYIRTAIHQISLFWQNNKNVLNNLEDWWRIFLYGAVFDNAFTSIKDCNVIRSESESVTYKDFYIMFKDIIPTDSKQKVEKVDMILRTTDNLFDVFSAEEKPLLTTSKVVQETIEKNQKRRVVTLDVIQKSLPLPELINEFVNYTALWHGNHVVLHCTRKIRDHYYHYETAKASIPLSPTNYEGIARTLLIVLSLKRHIMYNHKLVATLINEQSLMGLDEGGRSPIPFQQQDDSIEYDEDYIEQLKADLSGAEEKERHDQLRRYLDAIKSVSLGDEDEGIITTNSLSEIFQGMHTVDEVEPVHEPAYDMFENESSVIVRIDLPGVEREQVYVTASPPKMLKVTGARQAGSSSACLHNETYAKFSRSIKVEKAVDFKQTKTRLDSGVLEIIIPKEANVLVL